MKEKFYKLFLDFLKHRYCSWVRNTYWPRIPYDMIQYPLYLVSQRPDAPQGRISPDRVTGIPIS